MKKELQDFIIEDAWINFKDAIERAYYRGKKDAKDELFLEAKALIEVVTKVNPDSNVS